jgi:uncharacterized protein (TIGR02145 family)
MAFTLSCSSGDDNDEGGGGNSSPSYGGSSSSGGNNSGGSSSSFGGGSSSGGGNVQGGCPNVAVGNNTMTCGRKLYRTVKIGEQVWMAQNLNYAADGSVCYGNLESNCDQYGRLYDWSTAIDICPSGWHLPSSAEWNALSTYIENDMGCTHCAAAFLMAGGGGEFDPYGFSALMGGGAFSTGPFVNAGSSGYWWSSDTSTNDPPFGSSGYIYRSIDDGNDWSLRRGSNDESSLFSVRCIQD